jgi:hypothetical protein
MKRWFQDIYWYYLRGVWKYEKQLLKYQGYGNKSILEFKRKNSLEWNTINKILSNMLILDGMQVRNHIRKIYNDNKVLFEDPKTYISYFGPIGKSSGLILNQFLRCFPSKYYKLIPSTTIEELTDSCNVIFLDDFIGTGNQAVEYIKVINGSLNPSVKAFLFTIVATEEGLKKVRLYNSKFVINTSILLEDKKFFLLNPESSILDDSEKSLIKDLNSRLGITDKNEYHLGIPFSFYYSTPDNSLGILWNDKIKYRDRKNIEQEWYGLTPREY